MGRERLLDVSELEPPAPLAEALSALDSLGQGEYLRLRIKRDPVYLYPILLLQSFDYEQCPGSPKVYEILIWKKGDEEARQAVYADTPST